MKNKLEIKKDILASCKATLISEEDFAKKADISLGTLHDAYKGICNLRTVEKIYGAIYRLGLRFNVVKSELYKESLLKDNILLFHGSKEGINKLSINGSRDNCDFGNGFYCSESYSSAICFVEPYDYSSVYVLSIDLDDLSYINIPASLEWMIIVCYFRGMINKYEGHPFLKSCLDKIKDKDVIIAPIADNRMFQIMRDFGEGNITDIEAIHALSASRLGNQYVFKSEKALNKINFLERLYCSSDERKDSMLSTIDRKNVIDTKLRLAKREFRNQGVYIDEVFK